MLLLELFIEQKIKEHLMYTRQISSKMMTKYVVTWCVFWLEQNITEH